MDDRVTPSGWADGHPSSVSYARGIDLLNTAYNYLDLVPKGRED